MVELGSKPGACFSSTVRQGGGRERVLFLDMPDRICGCWWLTLIPRRADSFVGMRALGGLWNQEQDKSLNPQYKVGNGWTQCWVTQLFKCSPTEHGKGPQAKSEAKYLVENSLKCHPFSVLINQVLVKATGTPEEGTYVGWLQISVFYINMVSSVLQNCSQNLWKVI